MKGRGKSGTGKEQLVIQNGPHHVSNMAEAVLWYGHAWLPVGGTLLDFSDDAHIHKKGPKHPVKAAQAFFAVKNLNAMLFSPWRQSKGLTKHLEGKQTQDLVTFAKDLHPSIKNCGHIHDYGTVTISGCTLLKNGFNL